MKLALRTIAGLAVLSFTRAGLAEAGAPLCSSSDGCAPPTPYCHPTLLACVECLTARNCPASLTCDVASGSCVTCATDGDCTAERPYCAPEAGCVECRSNENCAAEGVPCSNGKCGTCGDGTCSRRERLFPEVEATPNRLFDTCVEDCESYCTADRVEPGGTAFVEVGERNLYEAVCDVGIPAPEGTVTFTAPSYGNYRVTVSREGDDDSPVSAGIIRGACPGEYVAACVSATRPSMVVELAARASATVVINGLPGERFQVSVTAPACVGPQCGPATPDSGAPGEFATARCLEFARARGDAMCSGVTCACKACPRDYDDCSVIPGCRAVSDCMLDSDCSGDACAGGGPCTNLISTHGGLDGPAFRAASALQACSRGASCMLPCEPADGGVSPDAGASSSDAPAPKDESSCDCVLAGSRNLAANLHSVLVLGTVAGAGLARRKYRRRAAHER